MGYSTNLTEKQWLMIEPVFKAKIGNYGNRAKHAKKDLVNAVLYVTKTGCQWRLLPNDFPPYSTVHNFYRRARISGLWEEIMALLVQKTREKAGRSKDPTYALIDSQSAKTTGAAKERGFDGGKKSQRQKAPHSHRCHGKSFGGQCSCSKHSRYSEWRRCCGSCSKEISNTAGLLWR